VQGRFLVDELVDGVRVRNYDETPGAGAALGCMVQVGIGGCGYEQPFKAIGLALGDHPHNEGFLRDDAALLVLVLSDEDDCSSTPGNELFDPDEAGFDSLLGPLESFRCTEFGVTCAEGEVQRAAGAYTDCRPDLESSLVEDQRKLRDLLVDLKGNASRVGVVTIAGDRRPFGVDLITSDAGQVARLRASCVGAGRTAAPAVRLRWLTDQFPHHAAASICSYFEEDLGGAADVALAIMGRR
jgi:hypothetical protein